MEEEIMRLNRLLGDVMVFARPSPVRLAFTSMPALVDRVLMLVREKLGHASIKVETSWHKTPPQVLCDPEQLVQVLLNLMLNSIQALENVEGERRILLEGVLEGDMLAISISDNGHGIEPSHFESLFDPFFTTKSQGGGLGLSIAQRIMQSHEGSLEADRHVATGARFTLRLPVSGPGGTMERKS